MKALKFNIVLLIFLCLISVRSVAQNTNLSVTISEKNFPERSDWGESLRITRLDFYVNDMLVGSLSTGLATTGTSTLTYNDFPLAGSQVISRMEITCIHHTWNVFGDRNETVSHSYPLTDQNLNGNGVAGTGTFSQFIELPMAVNWSFNYDIKITPFKADIINESRTICYHDSQTLTLNPQKPDFYTATVQFEWQYGFYSRQWIENPDFRTFISEVAYSLYSRCSAGPELSCENIPEAVINTNYSFMNEYEALYENPDNFEKYEIANHLLNGILISQSFLSSREQEFLRSNFITVLMEKDYWTAPYNSNYLVASWSLLGISFNPDGSITFNPFNLIDPASPGITRTAFRVRAVTAGQDGSFSSLKEFKVKPKAPEFTVTAEPSCRERETGIIRFSNVSGAVAGYKAVITDNDNNPTGSPEFFYGSEYTFMQKLLPGVYKADLYYSDPDITGCSNFQSSVIGQEKELSFNFSKSDATCPEKQDGKIIVNITQFADFNKVPGTCNIQLGSTSFNNTSGTFTDLDNQTYSINVSDFCTSRVQSVAIAEQNAVNVSISSGLDPACKSTPDGSLTAVASGSNGAYDFELFDGTDLVRTVSGSGPTYTFESLRGGIYTVKSRSDKCIAYLTSDQKSLEPVQELDFSSAVSDVRCFGTSTGEITLTATGGKPGYHYQLGTAPFTNNNEFSSLPAGTYQVTVHTRDMSCNDFKSRNITINSASRIQIAMDAVNASCFETDDGSVKASVSGGSGVYSYSWQEYIGGTWFLKPGSSDRLASLYAGSYRINVTDSYNCPVSADALVSEPPLLVIESAIPEDVVCFGGEGSITIAASGGSAGYEYSCHSDGGQVYKSSLSRMDLPAGNYYVTVKDAHGCESVFDDYADIKLTAPASPLDFTFFSPEYHGFNLRCKGDNSGAVSIIPTGGNGSGYLGYKYSLSGFPEKTEGSFTGLPAGTYNIKVTDGRGCITQKTSNLTEPPQLNLAIVSTENVKCFGSPTGEIRVAATGGISGTYSYKMDGTEMLSPGIFTKLYADTYQVGVSDINGCTSDLFATVQSLYPPIGIVMIPDDVRCFGENNGKISTIVSGGSGGFTYSWEINRGPGWQAFGSASGNLADLEPAKYRVRATDLESCNEYREVEIREPSRVIVSGAIPKDIVCFGGKGSLSISASGGSPGYTYYCREKSGIVYDSPLAELPLPAGVFNVSVKDGKGCEASYTGDISITAPPSSLDFTVSLSSYNGFNISCSGKNDGFLVAEASGGNGSIYSGYKYSVNGSPDAAGNRFSNLAKGSCIVRVTDARGCKVEKTLSLNEPQPLTAEILYSNPVRCFGESTGEFSVGANGGIEHTYKFSLNDKGEFSSGIFKNLYPGIYSVGVTDINGCSKRIQTTIVNKNPQISTQLAMTPVICKGQNNGTITSLVSGGAGGFSYSWQKRSATGWNDIQNGNHSASNLTAGFYRLNLRDADNCPSTDSIAVIEPSDLEISKVDIRDAVCFGEKGSFEIEVQGGNGGYSLFVSGDGGTTYNAYNSGNMLIPAAYRVKVRDIKGCELVEQELYSITKPDSPLDFNYVLSKYGAYNISCHGNDDGSISLLPSGGNSYGYYGYQFRLNDTKAVAENFINRLEAGNYEISVTDGRGCRMSKTLTLSEPASVMKLKVAAIEQPKCAYDNNGSVSLFAEGGNIPYEYSVNGSLFGSSSVFPDLVVARYNFKVRDANGCSEILDTALVNTVSEMKVTGVVSDVRCYGENSGSVNVNVSEGAYPYKFIWKDNSSVSSSRILLSKGEYTVSITDAAGCLSEKSFSVKEPEQPLSISAFTSPACAELKNGTIKAGADGGTPPYMFAIDRKNDFASASLFDVFAGDHIVYVSDLNNCLSEASVSVGVRNVRPDINFMLATSRYELDTLVIIDVSVPVPDKVSWEFPEGTIVIDTAKHKAMIKYTQAGLYPVKMTGTFGTCTYLLDKLLSISPFDPLVGNEDLDHTGIKSLVISPNPNDGRFMVNLELYSKQEIAVRVFDFYSRVLFSEKWPADISFRKEIYLPENTLPGNYVLWIIGEKDSRPLIFVISR